MPGHLPENPGGLSSERGSINLEPPSQHSAPGGREWLWRAIYRK